MEPNFFQRWSLKTRVTLGTLLIFVSSIWVLAFYASRTLHDDMQSLLGEQQFSTASFLAKEINEEMGDRLRALENGAARLTAYILGDKASLQKFLEQRTVIHSMFSGGLVVYASDGTAIAEVPLAAGRLGGNYLEGEAVGGALKLGEATIGRPIMSKTLRTPLFAMAVPVRDQQGKIIGALAGATDLGKPNFLDKINESTYGRTGGYLVVSPKNRLIVTATDKRRIMEVLPERGVIPQMDRFIDGYEGSSVIVNARGAEVLVSVKRIPIATWYVVASLPTADAFAPIGAMQWRILMATLLLTLLAGLLIWWLLRRQLAPLLDTASILATLPAPNQSAQPLPVARQDEVGKLIGGFNRLLEALGQRELALRESEARFRSLTAMSSDFYWETDAEHRFIARAAAGIDSQASVYRDGSHIGRRPWELPSLAPDEAGWRAHRARLDAHQPFRDFEVSRPGADGDACRFLLSGDPLFDARGAFTGYRGVGRDITERSRAETAHRESEERFRTLIEWSPEPHIVSRGGKIIYVNPAAIGMFGAAKARDLVGANVLDRVHPDSHALLWARRKLVIEEKEAAPLVELKYLRLDGTPIEAEVQTIGIIFDGAAAYHTIVRDITQRKRAEETRARLAAIVENSNDAIFSRTLDGTILSWNNGAEKMLGFSAAEAIGKPIGITLPPEMRSRVPEINEAMLRGEVVANETERVTRDGRVIHVQSSISPIKDAAGSIVGVSVILQDIGERKRTEVARAELEAQLREAQKMEAIGTLAGGIAHDFNNIIATIMGNAELAHQDSRANPQALASLEEIQKAARRARDLVQQILSFSRRQPTERKPIALAPVVEESARLLRATLPARVALDVHCAADVPAVLADATQIEQALINVATNAMQAMQGNPGRIVIHLDTVLLDQAYASAHPVLRAMYERQPGRTVRLAIKDDGPGMDPGTLARIFEPFFTTKPVDEGTGLGLSVVHGILQAHQGAIDVESAPGKGATFTLYLPASANAVAMNDAAATLKTKAAETGTKVPASAAGAAAVPATGDGRHILYLDDDEALVYLVERLLKRQGFRVSAFIEQSEALAALRAEPGRFDLVVSDYNMPGMSGLEVALEVRAIRADLPVAIASGFIDETLRAEAAGAGVCELIFKADSVEEFCAIVRRLAQAVAPANS